MVRPRLNPYLPDTSRLYLNPVLLDGMDVRIGEAFRARRHERGYRLDEMAGKLGCSLQQLHKNERGRDQISLHRLMLFCMEAKISPGRILTGLGVETYMAYPLAVVDEPVFRDNLRERLTIRREVMAMTQDFVSDCVGIGIRQLRNYETGLHKIRPAIYFKLAAVLCLTPHEAVRLAVRSAESGQAAPAAPKA